MNNSQIFFLLSAGFFFFQLGKLRKVNREYKNILRDKKEPVKKKNIKKLRLKI